MGSEMCIRDSRSEGAGPKERSLEAWGKENKNPRTFSIEKMSPGAYVMIHGGSLLTKDAGQALSLLEDLSLLQLRSPTVPFPLCTQVVNYFSIQALLVLLAHVGSTFAFLVHKIDWSKSLVLGHTRSSDLQPLRNRTQDQCDFFKEKLDICQPKTPEQKQWVTEVQELFKQLLALRDDDDRQKKKDALKRATETAIRLASEVASLAVADFIPACFGDGAFDRWLLERSQQGCRDDVAKPTR